MRRLGVRLLVGGCMATTFHDIVGYPASVSGDSMFPTLIGSDNRWWKRDIVWLTSYKVGWGPQGPALGDIVAFISPRDPKKVHIKRVAAIEGDLIRPKHRAELMIVSKGTYWMEGDNPINSNDSNTYGPVNQGLLRSRATHVIWPPDRWQKL